MLINLERCNARGIQIDCYYREINDIDLNALSRLNINLYQIEGLHAKLYFNESQVIVTSMNLYEYSDINSIEIGMLYEGENEYQDVYGYFEKYIKSARQEKSTNSDKNYSFFRKSKQIFIDKNLYDLNQLLNTTYLDAKFTITSEYIFCGNLLPIFDVMFFGDEIRFKVPNKNFKADCIKELSLCFKQIRLCKSNLEEPSESRSFYNFYVA